MRFILFFYEDFVTMMRYCVLCFIFCGGVIAAIDPNKIDGYATGLFSNCPGSTKEAIITRKSLKHLTLTVQGPGDTMSATRTRYNYYQMKQLAKDPEIDFATRKTLVYVGGFLDSPVFPLARNIAVVYKEIGYNVLLLDTNTFTTVEYHLAARFMRPVGKHVAEMLAELTKLGLDPKRTEVVGLSLGGQTASFIAKGFQQLTATNFSRLTGLDPAGPCFRNRGPKDRIDKSDADLVDIISTNIDGFGMAAPVGHINIYINGGEYQPGEFYWLLCDLLCSHTRSFNVWLAAVRFPDKFIAMQCDSVQQARDKNCYDRRPLVTNLLGMKTDPTKQGIFYLSTTNAYPFYLGVKGLRRENDFVVKKIKLNDAEVIKM